MKATHDAIVIGAGPAGASVASALARKGWAVAIIEKSEFPRRKVCGEFISATNAALLDVLDVGPAWRADAGPEIRRVGFFARDICVEAPMPRAAAGGYGRALGRDILDGLLLDAARSAGAEILQPWRAVGIEQVGDAQSVRIQSRTDGQTDEKILRAPVIVAAHGSWEQGKLASQLPKTNRPSDLLGFKAHFTGSSLAADLMPLLIFPGGYGGMVWTDHGRLSLSCCIRRDVLAELRAVQGNVAAAEAVHRHIVGSCRGVSNAIGSARLDGPWLAAGPIRPGIRRRYDHDIFRVGNIAGESHPIIAEGISMAIQSGWLLAAELVRVDRSKQSGRTIAGRRYAAAWRRLFATRIHAASVFAHIAVQPGSARAMRAVINWLPQTLTLGAALSGKTKPVPGLG